MSIEYMQDYIIQNHSLKVLEGMYNKNEFLKNLFVLANGTR